MQPTEDRVLIRPLPKDSVTAAGIIIPEEAKGKPTKAEVLLIGTDEKIRVRPGDFILFPEHAGYDLNWEGVDVKMIRWVDIQAILDRDVESAQSCIQKTGVAIISFQQTLFKGMSNEMLELDINGNKFFLRGNVLMPATASGEPPVATVQEVSIGVGATTGKQKVAEILHDMNRTHGK